MKAIVYEKYGSPDVLQLKEIEKPIPKENEVLIKVYAASVNSWDWDLLRGTPFIVRLAGGGLQKPKKKILGCDVAGKVESVGSKVKKFQRGDEVFGDLSQGSWGGFAEFVCAHEDALLSKPASLSFEEVAALPQAGVMALQSIRDKGKVQSGQKVLVNGAGGGVGIYAIQIAKTLGAEITAVDSTHKLDMLRSIGADHVIDYKQEDFTRNEKRYDLIVDVVANRSIFDYKRSLNSTGIFVMIGGTTSALLQTAFLGPLVSKWSKKKMGILMHEPNKDLEFLTNLLVAGQIKSIIDGHYTLPETAEALRHLGEGHAKGKVVITVKR